MAAGSSFKFSSWSLNMSHSSPAAYLVWTLLCGMLNVFLIFHLWSFDRFQCLKWNSHAHAGAFKRIMTYTYLITVPMVFTYSLGNLVIKYREGFIQLPPYGIIPKPWQLWDKAAQNTLFPFTLLFSVSWSLEMVTHLEELCFWLFLVNAGSVQQNWFHSPYFKTWIIGSVVAVCYMPTVTILTRSDPLKNEAFTFLAGSIGSFSLTIWFVPILWTFPAFLRNLRHEGVDISTIVRLTKFSELNTIRVLMRFLFSIPLIILGVDGIQTHHHINGKMLYTDLLAMISAFGVTISSGITLVIFFPRSIEGEIAARDAAKERKRSRAAASHVSTRQHTTSFSRNQDAYLLSSSPVTLQHSNLYSHDDRPHELTRSEREEEERDVPAELNLPRKSRANELSESNLSIHNIRLMAAVNPMISNFTSPIDLIYAAPEEGRRLTFRPRV